MLGGVDFESFIEAIVWSRGRAIYVNFPPYMLPNTFTLKTKLQDAIDGASGATQGDASAFEFFFGDVSINL